MNKDTSDRYIGSFELLGLKVFGELKINFSKSQLNLRTEEAPPLGDLPKVLHGKLHDFTFVSCLDCVGASEPDVKWNSRGNKCYYWNIFPHFIITGDRYLNPVSDRISEVWFSISDAALVFNDFDSYGIIHETSIPIKDLIPETIGVRQVPIGPMPKLAYFAGRREIHSIDVSDARIEVQHWPTYESGTSEGIRLGSSLMLGIRFGEAAEFEACLKTIKKLVVFLSLVAGRSQGVRGVTIGVHGAEERARPLSLHWSFAPQVTANEEQDEPSFLDMPLDAIRRPEEFARVLSSWWDASESQELARSRLYSCRARGNLFDVDRLVAAANMFDLLDIAVSAAVSEELSSICRASVKQLKTLPKTDERDSVIMALRRVGNPTLRKKIMERANLVASCFELKNIDEVVRIAVKCRNYFVHGGGDTSFSYPVVEPFIHFLTETLEFIFSTAELIECGWDFSAWRNKLRTHHHWFSRYLSFYHEECQGLLIACARIPKN